MADVLVNEGPFIGPPEGHAESHTVVSHSDTGATGAELDTLTDGSDASALHNHGFVGWGLRKTVDQTISTGDNDVIWQTEDFDTDGFHAGTSEDVIIPSGQAGFYQINVQLLGNPEDDEFIKIQLQLDDVTIREGWSGSGLASAGTGVGVVTFSTVLNLSVAEVVKLVAVRGAGENWDLLAETGSIGDDNEGGSWFEGYLIGV